MINSIKDNKIYILLIILFVGCLLSIQKNDILFSEKNPYDTNQIGKIENEGFYFHTAKIVFHDIHNKVKCTKILDVVYDCDYDIYEDIHSIQWKSKSIFEVKVKKDGRLYRKYHNEHLYLNNNCKFVEKLGDRGLSPP